MRRDAVEFGVQLQGRDELLGAGDLEVHIAERVLGAEDVGECDIPRLTVNLIGHQTHRDTGHRRLQWHTGVQQRQCRSAHRPHRRRTVGTQRLRDLPDGVGELLDAGQYRHQGALSECAVADLAPFGRAHPAGLTGRIRREVVVVHIALGLLRPQRVDLLGHLDHVERGDTHDLGLATLEQRAAVGTRDDRHLGTQRPDIGNTAAVDAEVVGQDALAHKLFGQRAECRADLLLAPGEVLAQPVEHIALDLLGALVTLLLAGDGECLGQRIAGDVGDGRVGVVGVVREHRVVGGLLGSLLGQRTLRRTQGGDERLGRLQPLGDDALGGRGGAAGDQLDDVVGGLGLDHHDRDIPVADDSAGDNHVEHRALELLNGRERHPLVLNERHPHGTDRTGERQARNLGGGRRGVDRQHVVQIVGIEAQDRDHDLDLVAQAGDKRRAQRPVNQAAGEDRVRGRPSLAAEERAGDAARGIHPLLDVDGQREEVEVLFG